MPAFPGSFEAVLADVCLAGQVIYTQNLVDVYSKKCNIWKPVSLKYISLVSQLQEIETSHSSSAVNQLEKDFLTFLGYQ